MVCECSRSEMHPRRGGGEILDTVNVDRGCFACMLGGDDGRTLFIVANHYSAEGASDGIVLTQRTSAAHAGRP